MNILAVAAGQPNTVAKVYFKKLMPNLVPDDDTIAKFTEFAAKPLSARLRKWTNNAIQDLQERKRGWQLSREYSN